MTYCSDSEIKSLYRWYVFSTKSRHEFVVFEGLKAKGFQVHLPVRTVIKKWSDRKKKITEPLFKGYIFVNVTYKQRLQVLQTPGIVRMVMFNGRPGVLHKYEIDSIKKLAEANESHNVYVESLDGIVRGDHVVVTCGPLAGLRGVFSKIKNENRLIISIDSIGKSLAVEVPVDVIKKAATS